MTSPQRDWRDKYPCENEEAREKLEENLKYRVVGSCGCHNCSEKDFIQSIINSTLEEAAKEVEDTLEKKPDCDDAFFDRTKENPHLLTMLQQSVAGLDGRNEGIHKAASIIRSFKSE